MWNMDTRICYKCGTCKNMNYMIRHIYKNVSFFKL